MQAEQTQRVETVEQALERMAEQIKTEAFALELRKLLAHNEKAECVIELKPSGQGGINLTMATRAICSKSRKSTFLRVE